MRAYTVDIDEDEGTIIGVVADTAKEAKGIAYYAESIDREWIHVTAKWCKGVDVSGLSKGVIHPYEGVKLGIYGWVEDTCPVCKKTEQLYLQSDGTITCNECYEDRAIIQQQLQPDSRIRAHVMRIGGDDRLVIK